MSLKGIDVLTAAQFSREQIEQLFARADDFAARLDQGEHIRLLDGKLLATVFYEPSTRTRLSFEAAMQRLGGGVISVAKAKTASSVVKGETLPDTIRAIANYADAIVLRHPEIGAAQVAAEASNVPILNAGDGAGEHPTQALLDLYTIRAEKKTIDGLRVALVGDLKNGRTVHSLACARSNFKIEFSLVALAMIAFALSSISFHWNDFLWPLVVTNSASSRPLTVSLAVFTQLGEIGAQWSFVTAGTVIVVGPLLLLFLIFQRQFIESFLHSGLK